MEAHLKAWNTCGPYPGEPGAESSALHSQREQAVLDALIRTGASSVMDLGCGEGALLAELAQRPQFSVLTGCDANAGALSVAEQRLRTPAGMPGRVRLIHGSFDKPDLRLSGHAAAVMIEAIEHIDPRRLSAMEHAQFGVHRPGAMVITTPNVEYNELYGLPSGVLRHPGHRFEWTRAKFRAWAHGVARRHGYSVAFQGIGAPDAARGCPTQMAVFSRAT